MFGSSYKVATIAGIPIKIHISLLLMVLLLSRRFGPLTGILLEVGLVVSIVLHELGHSMVAIRKGCRVREITLLCVGGAAQMERIPSRPRDEFLMAVAGPAVSLVLGVTGVYLGNLLTFLPPVPTLPVNLNFIQFLGVVNIVLTVFNLLPAFPMDGGRVLRAMLTPKLGRLRATFIALRLGRLIAVLLGIRGFFAHDWILVFIAFFIFIAAGNEYRVVQIQEAAKQRGFTWPGFEDVCGSDEDDQAVVGPPPYRQGPGSRADIRTERKT